MVILDINYQQTERIIGALERIADALEKAAEAPPAGLGQLEQMVAIVSKMYRRVSGEDAITSEEAVDNMLRQAGIDPRDIPVDDLIGRLSSAENLVGSSQDTGAEDQER